MWIFLRHGKSQFNTPNNFKMIFSWPSLEVGVPSPGVGWERKAAREHRNTTSAEVASPYVSRYGYLLSSYSWTWSHLSNQRPITAACLWKLHQQIIDNITPYNVTIVNYKCYWTEINRSDRNVLLTNYKFNFILFEIFNQKFKCFRIYKCSSWYWNNYPWILESVPLSNVPNRETDFVIQNHPTFVYIIIPISTKFIYKQMMNSWINKTQTFIISNYKL